LEHYGHCCIAAEINVDYLGGDNCCWNDIVMMKANDCHYWSDDDLVTAVVGHIHYSDDT